MVLRIIIPAIIKTVAIFVIYFLGASMYNDTVATTAAFLTLATIEILFSYVCRSDKKTVFQIGFFKNIPMLLSVIFSLALQIAVMFIPLTVSWLGIEVLSANMYMNIAFVIIITIILMEITKVTLAKIFRKNK